MYAIVTVHTKSQPQIRDRKQTMRVHLWQRGLMVQRQTHSTSTTPAHIRTRAWAYILFQLVIEIHYTKTARESPTLAVNSVLVLPVKKAVMSVSVGCGAIEANLCAVRRRSQLWTWT